MYKAYISEGLYALTNNMSLTKRFSEVREKPQPQKSGDEIVKEVMERHGLKFKDECI